MKAKYLIIIVLFVFASCSKPKEIKVIAHRGYWDTEGSAQNSITSLQKADQAGCYASEFDVWMTKDNMLIVNHDDAINGKIITETFYSDLKDYKLPNEEEIPTLDVFLRKAKDMKIRLVLELKPMKPEREVTASAFIANMLKKYGLVERTDLISFSLSACKQLKYQLPDSKVFYLNGDLSPEELQKMNLAGMDYQASVIREHPDWIKSAHKLGQEVNVWTVNKEEDIIYFIDNQVDYITTNNPVLAMELIKKRK